MYGFAVNSKLKQLIEECLQLMEELQVPVSTSVYFKECKGFSRFGYCKRNTNTASRRERAFQYTVAINRYFLHDEDCKTTIIHELLHTIGSKLGHTGDWKKWAKYVNAHTPYNVGRTASFELQPIAYRNRRISTGNYDPATMDVAECPKCHMRIYIRKERGVKASGATKYICKKCKQRIRYI
ncbi:MAG: hypothetical protein J1F68_02725 [Clostridiales bacterium]|nr:hypothetical protein [Clostridiales bacterium]